MRLWHKDLIKVLPRHQLLSQWRECCCIAKLIRDKGTPNHLLVNKILDYTIDHFMTYTYNVIHEMQARGYVVNVNRCFVLIPNWTYISKNELFNGWHNDRYLAQCYYNLQEKYDCGGITQAEWELIEDNFLSRIK